MEEINDQIEQRIKKLDETKAMGVEPFGGVFDAKDHAAELLNKYEAHTKEALESSPSLCVIAGRIVAMRDFREGCVCAYSGFNRQDSGLSQKDVLNEKYSVVKKFDIGDIIGVSGKLFRTRTNELTVEVEDFQFLTKSLRPLPEKWHGLKDIEMRYRQRYVDLIVNPEVKEAFKKEALLSRH